MKTTILFNNKKKLTKFLPKNWHKNQMYIDIIRDFLEKIIKNKKVQIPLKEGIYTLKVALALKESLNKSKKIID